MVADRVFAAGKVMRIFTPFFTKCAAVILITVLLSSRAAAQMSTDMTLEFKKKGNNVNAELVITGIQKCYSITLFAVDGGVKRSLGRFNPRRKSASARIVWRGVSKVEENIKPRDVYFGFRCSLIPSGVVFSESNAGISTLCTERGVVKDLSKKLANGFKSASIYYTAVSSTKK